MISFYEVLVQLCDQSAREVHGGERARIDDSGRGGGRDGGRVGGELAGRWQASCKSLLGVVGKEYLAGVW